MRITYVFYPHKSLYLVENNLIVSVAGKTKYFGYILDYWGQMAVSHVSLYQVLHISSVTCAANEMYRLSREKEKNSLDQGSPSIILCIPVKLQGLFLIKNDNFCT